MREEHTANRVDLSLPNQSAQPLEWLDLSQLIAGSQTMGLMVARSATLRAVFAAIGRLSPHRTAVLVQGESGTGKELAARALHSCGPSPAGPFVTFNCSNLIDALAESQLFGHVRGAFTDAHEESQGYFRSANGGTLFLDEIGELAPRLQAKLLRVVETFEVQPLGSSRSYHVDVRLVAATNRDLRAMIKTGQFRDDLFYRLSATSIVIPPLRSHPEDIDVLAGHFIERYNRILGKSVKYLSSPCLSLLRSYEWPGNARELANAIESAIIFTSSDRIDLADLPVHLIECARTNVTGFEDRAASLPTQDPLNLLNSIGDTIKAALLRSLKESRGNRRRAAELLGVSRSTLYRLLSRYEIM